MKIVYDMYSIEAEGQKAGLPTLFIEFFGCNSRCPYCTRQDDEYKEMSPDALLQLCLLKNIRHVYLDCGEPLLQSHEELLRFITCLIEEGFSPTLQTNGFKRLDRFVSVEGLTIFLFVRPGITALSNLNLLRKTDQVKFVVTNAKEYHEAIAIIQKHKPACPVYLFPHPRYGNEKTLYNYFLQDAEKDRDLQDVRMTLLENLYIGLD